MGHRMSSLPIVQYCGAAGRIQKGSGRSALMSQAFHATCSKDPTALEKMARLTEEERSDIGEWHPPTETEVAGRKLTYEEAEKELEVALDAMGFHTTADDSPLTIGHLDFAWVLEHEGRKLGVVADIKRQRFTSTPDTLQLHAYGTAFALSRDCDTYVTGLWLAEEGEWWWSATFVEIGSAEHNEILHQILMAAKNDAEEFCPGSHCVNCWGRGNCPEWTFSGATAETWLAPLAEGKLGSPDELGALVLKVKAAKELVEKAESALKMHRLSGGIVRHQGAYWTPYEVQGRESTSVKKVREVFGPEAEKVVTRSKPHTRFKWVEGKS